MTDTRVRFLDLQAQYGELRSEIQRAVEAVFASQAFVLGPAVAEFETALGRYLGGVHVVGVASGTDALYLALRAAGIGPGDAVVTTPYSFAASATQIARTGARPYFVDIEPDSFNVDPRRVARFLDEECRRDGERLRAPGGEIVRAILPVHLFGRPCAIDELATLARRHGLDVIEDAAQVIGGRVGGTGAYAGTVGRFGCFSFYPTKNLGGAGDGGCVVTRDAADADRVRSLARHGVEGGPYRHVELGLASRLDAIQAAVLGVKLARIDDWNAARRRHAERYDHLLTAAFGAARVVGAPAIVPGHVFHQYVVRVPGRDRVRAALAADGIETQVYYPIPLHLQPCFAALGHRPGDRPEAERASAESLALPIYPELDDAAARAVVERLARVCGRADGVRRRELPSALTIAGSDSGGGAGIQADLKTFAARGVHGTCAITAVTAQDTSAVHAVTVLRPTLVRAQIDAVLDDLGADAVKTGMLGSAAVVVAVADAIAVHRVKRLVVDPVLHATGGRSLLTGGGAAMLLRRLVPLAEIVTPNLAEASVMVGFPVRDVRAMEEAGRVLVAAGARAAVVTGGHLAGDPVDVAFIDGVLHRFRGRRVPGASPHGTGCTFAAAIAAERAKDVPLLEAIRAAKRYVTMAIRRAHVVGRGRPILGHLPR